MKIWQITDSKQLFLHQSDNESLINSTYPIETIDKFNQFIPTTPSVKVKVSKANITQSDISTFLGKGECYPIVPCRSAVAYISDTDNASFKQGERVFLSPYRVNDSGVIKISGAQINGYLGNYISVVTDNIYPIPEGVSEEDALFIEDIAISINVLNKLNIDKGEYLALYGASLMNCIIAQLAIYYQAIPIIIDNDARRLDKAIACGVYYTVDTTVEMSSSKIKEITSGKLVDKLIVDCDTFPQLDEIMPFVKYNGKIAMFGFSSKSQTFTSNLNKVISHELEIVGVHNGASEIHSAINLLANKVLKLNNFIEKVVSFDNFIQDMRYISSKANPYKNIVEIK